MNVWFGYPLLKAVAYIVGMKYDVRCHVLRIGPLAFAVIWRCRRNEETVDATPNGGLES